MSVVQNGLVGFGWVFVLIVALLDVECAAGFLLRLAAPSVAELFNGGWELTERVQHGDPDPMQQLAALRVENVALIAIVFESGTDRRRLLEQLFGVSVDAAVVDADDNDISSEFRAHVVTVADNTRFLLLETPRDSPSDSIELLAAHSAVAFADIVLFCTVGGFSRRTRDRLLHTVAAAHRTNTSPLLVVVHQVMHDRDTDTATPNSHVEAIARVVASSLRSASHIAKQRNLVRYTLADEATDAAMIDVRHFVLNLMSPGAAAVAAEVREVLRIAPQRAAVPLLDRLTNAIGDALLGGAGGELWRSCERVDLEAGAPLLVTRRPQHSNNNGALVVALSDDDNVCIGRRHHHSNSNANAVIASDEKESGAEPNAFAPRVLQTVTCHDVGSKHGSGGTCDAIAVFVSAVGATNESDFFVEIRSTGARRGTLHHLRVVRLSVPVDMHRRRVSCSGNSESRVATAHTNAAGVEALVPVIMRAPDIGNIELRLDNGVLGIVVRTQRRSVDIVAVVKDEVSTTSAPVRAPPNRAQSWTLDYVGSILVVAALILALLVCVIVAKSTRKGSDADGDSDTDTRNNGDNENIDNDGDDVDRRDGDENTDATSKESSDDDGGAPANDKRKKGKGRKKKKVQ